MNRCFYRLILVIIYFVFRQSHLSNSVFLLDYLFLVAVIQFFLKFVKILVDVLTFAYVLLLKLKCSFFWLEQLFPSLWNISFLLWIILRNYFLHFVKRSKLVFFTVHRDKFVGFGVWFGSFARLWASTTGPWSLGNYLSMCFIEMSQLRNTLLLIHKIKSTLQGRLRLSSIQTLQLNTFSLFDRHA